ncbi:MAG: hypothetical protein ACYC44_01805 [Patescibacteria group bacterium]
MRNERRFSLTEIGQADGLRWLDPRDFENRGPLADAEFDHIFDLKQARWLHSGDPKQPHVELTSGKHSNGFVAVPLVLADPNLCEIMAIQAEYVIRKAMKDLGLPAWETGNKNWVIGSDHAGATFSQRVAARLQAKHDFTEKGPDKKLADGTNEKTQMWTRHTIEPDEFVLQAEELVTTTATMIAVRKAIRAGTLNPVKFYPLNATLVHRSPQYDFEGSPIVWVRHYDIETWENAATCPLCQQGSKAIMSPKKHWAELTGKAA